MDLLEIDPIEGVDFIQGDFRENDVLDKLYRVLDGAPVDLVMSDMAPNISGIKDFDQPRIMLLAELAKNFALEILAPQGHFLTKIFQGEGFDNYIKELRTYFKPVVSRKPTASRSRSSEVYVLAKNYNKK